MVMTLLYFILALFLLITVHEFGHFIVARWCGVKVLRFSFGFGKVLAKWKDKKGTEYAWSILPLGGYVKMLDESEGDVLPEERPFAFNNKSIWARIAIVLAGPIFNFIFAFIAIWLVFMIGMTTLAPIVGEVRPQSPAAQMGLKPQDEIVAINQQSVKSWMDFQYALLPLIGSDETVNMRVKSLTDGSMRTLRFPLQSEMLLSEKADKQPLDQFGIKPFIPLLPTVIGGIQDDSPAQKAGLQKGDKVLRADAEPMNDWLDLVSYVKKHPQQRVHFDIERQGKLMQLAVLIGNKNENGHQEGILGVTSAPVNWPKSLVRNTRLGPMAALSASGERTGQLIGSTFTLIGRFITGKLSVNAISGPVGIAQGAGESARSGLVYYLMFLALVSISLGVLNILPIPMLDGGHLLYFLIELLKGKPLSESVRSAGFYLGIVLLATLMFLALTNDISRLVS